MTVNTQNLKPKTYESCDVCSKQKHRCLDPILSFGHGVFFKGVLVLLLST